MEPLVAALVAEQRKAERERIVAGIAAKTEPAARPQSYVDDCRGEQWTGLHPTVDMLFTLGLAAGRVVCLMPRELWDALPGGMPYYMVREHAVPDRGDEMLTYGTLTHDGVEYEAIPARITRTDLGYEDHGIFTVSIRFEWGGGSSQSMPGYGFGKDDDEDKIGAFLRRVLAVVGVTRWEDVPGKPVFALLDRRTIRGMASMDGRTVFVAAELFADEVTR